MIDIQNKSLKKYFYLSWVLVGLAVLWCAYFTFSNNFTKLAFSYPDDDVYEIDHTQFQSFAPADGGYSLGLYVELSKYEVNYIRIKAEGTTDETKFSFKGLSAVKGNVLEKTAINNVDLTDGINDFELHTQDFEIAYFTVVGAEPTVIKSIEFRRIINETPSKSAAPFLCGVFAVYLILSICTLLAIKALKRKKDSRQRAITTKPTINKGLHLAIPEAMSSWIRTFLWLVLMIMTIKVEIEDNYFGAFRKHLAIQLLILVLILLLMCTNERLKYRPVKSANLFIPLTTFSLYTFISDIAVDKTFRFEGILVFIIITALSILLVNRGAGEIYIKDFVRATEWFLFFLVIISVLFKQETVLGRFSGPIKNPSIYALYLTSIWAILLGKAEKQLVEGDSVARGIVTTVELIVTLTLCVLSQSLCPLITVGIISVIWLYRIVSFKIGKRYAVVTFALLAILTVGLLALIITHIDDMDFISETRLAVKIKESDPSIVLSYRDYYYRQYLRNMNLLGHGHRPLLWGHKILPHNAVIGMAYMYGVPIIVPYILLMLGSIEKAWKYAGKSIRNSAVPMYSILSFVIMSIADNVEQPFVWLPWIACYMMMPPILLMPVEEIEAPKIENTDICTEESEQI